MVIWCFVHRDIHVLINKLTPRSRVIVVKLIVAQLVLKLIHYEVFQEPSFCALNPRNPNHTLTDYFCTLYSRLPIIRGGSEMNLDG
jgi:hypothetical protein